MRTLGKLLILAGVVCAILSMAGCIGDIKSMGGGPWPEYAEPSLIVFSAKEAEVLNAFAAANPELFKKIQGQSHAYREIVRVHNRAAREHNKKQLEAMGINESDLELYRKALKDK